LERLHFGYAVHYLDLVLFFSMCNIFFLVCLHNLRDCMDIPAFLTVRLWRCIAAFMEPNLPSGSPIILYDFSWVCNVWARSMCMHLFIFSLSLDGNNNNHFKYPTFSALKLHTHVTTILGNWNLFRLLSLEKHTQRIWGILLLIFIRFLFMTTLDHTS